MKSLNAVSMLLEGGGELSLSKLTTITPTIIRKASYIDFTSSNVENEFTKLRTSLTLGKAYLIIAHISSSFSSSEIYNASLEVWDSNWSTRSEMEPTSYDSSTMDLSAYGTYGRLSTDSGGGLTLVTSFIADTSHCNIKVTAYNRTSASSSNTRRYCGRLWIVEFPSL